MVLNEQNLKKALEQPLRHGVYYYYSTEEYLVRSYAAKTLALLAKQEDDAEVTRVEGRGCCGHHIIFRYKTHR